MKPINSIARMFIAPVFLTGGIDALMHPDSKSVAAEKALPQLQSMGFTGSAARLVRLNGGMQLAAGLLVFIGRLPRVASAALAVSLVPTTLASHQFWKIDDPTLRKADRVQFFKNAALIGGLLMAATASTGSPSLSWRAKRGVRNASGSLQSARENVLSHLSHDSFSDRVSDRAGVFNDKLHEVALPLVERGMERGMDRMSEVNSSVGDLATRAGESIQARTNSFVRSLQ
jgi:uncharacterized membrane protein YphA (DoxX/SURF4 family)